MVHRGLIVQEKPEKNATTLFEAGMPSASVHSYALADKMIEGVGRHALLNDYYHFERPPQFNLLKVTMQLASSPFDAYGLRTQDVQPVLSPYASHEWLFTWSWKLS